MVIPAPSNSNEEPVPDYIANFNDIHGWYYAWTRTEYSWRGWSDDSRPVRLYYPASLQYNVQDDYNAIDGMGRQIPGNQPFACTINPSSGKFERLCVQTRDSFCTLDNSTWDRTVIRNTAPRLFRLANSIIPLFASSVKIHRIFFYVSDVHTQYTSYIHTKMFVLNGTIVFIISGANNLLAFSCPPNKSDTTFGNAITLFTPSFKSATELWLY
jgi:hypothetical protein